MRDASGPRANIRCLYDSQWRFQTRSRLQNPWAPFVHSNQDLGHSAWMTCQISGRQWLADWPEVRWAGFSR